LIYKQKITLKDIKTNIHIGITENERNNEQKVLITVEIVPSINIPLKNDSIYETINYSEIRETILNISSSRSFNLLETLCWKIAKTIKNNFKIDKISVTVKKFPYNDVEYVSYSLTI